ncbi:MAG: Crp/Fnr family transcriptional regulator [Pseudomonadota bacterium]|nr:Crp/Fnr family transcriptional regulator [Pseudomonadota bacterium]
MRSTDNHLIELLPRKDRRHMRAICETVDLVLSEVLCESGSCTAYVYFPVDSIVSLVTPIDGKPVLEVGMVGREGMVGAQLVLGVMASPLHAVAQGSGKTWRASAAAFRSLLTESTALQFYMNRYLYVLMSQLAVSAACLRFHLIGPRLARWLLMSQDRAHADTFQVTHEFLAYMLGVRRVGITLAAGALQRKRLIEYKRGQLRVLNRAGLEAAACGCYATDKKLYADLLG